MNKDLYIVGVGASAGGIPAINAFFDHIKPLPNVAFIVVMHLRRNYLSNLSQIISKHTSLPVTRLENDTCIQSNHIYVLIENTFITTDNGIVKVRKREEHEIVNQAIDILFKSLAEDFKAKAIGIVFSGAGSDGLEGVKAIGKYDGYVMVQSPYSSDVDGMPQSVVKFDQPDVIEIPEQLAKCLVKYINSKELTYHGQPDRQ
ncbi:MAG TPA: chemotaxis protein CheB [Mucilaginibacter sp.]